jgi:hypothetical protein
MPVCEKTIEQDWAFGCLRANALNVGRLRSLVANRHSRPTRHMPGYPGTPLASKLGIKPGYSLLVVGAPTGYQGLLHPLPEGVVFTRKASERTDLVHFFSASKSGLSKALTQYRAKLKPSCSVWVSWPKKSSKVATDITEDSVREVALPLGFVDVKVCAVTEVWSGLKLVVRKELR